MTIEEKINSLPDDAKKEIFDFIDFIFEKNHREKDMQWNLKISEKSFNKIWDNTEDDIYNELL